MGRKIQYLVRAGLFTARYLVCPLVVVFGITFSILIMPIISSQSINYSPLILLSLVYGWIFATPIFFVQIAFSIGKRFEKKANNLENRLTKKFKPSIKTRLELKKYFGALSISMFLVCSVLFGKSIVTQLKATPKGFELPPIELVVAYITTIVAVFFFQLYIVVYRQTERALFFLEQSVENINYCLENGIRRPYIRFFEKALKAYQKTMPSFCSMDLEKRIRQTELVFRRGTKDDIIKTRDMINSLADSIRQQNPASFDKFEKRKKKNDTYKLEMIPRRRALKNTIFQLGLKRDVWILVAIGVIAFVAPNAKDIIDLLSRLF